VQALVVGWGEGNPLTPEFPPNASCPGTVAPAKHPKDRLGCEIPESTTGGYELQQSTLMQLRSPQNPSPLVIFLY